MFFDFEVIKPFAIAYGIDDDVLEPHLAIAKELIQSKGFDSVDQPLEYLSQFEDSFPAAVQVLQLAMTFPATSASSEWSFSALKKIKNYLWSTMYQKRLCNLQFFLLNIQLLNHLT